MDTPAIFIAALIVLPAVGLVSWASLCMAQIEADLHEFSAGSDRMLDHRVSERDRADAGACAAAQTQHDSVATMQP